MRVSKAELSRRLEELEHPIAVLGLSRIEAGLRRVDVDDLTALTLALDVSPAALLMPGLLANASDSAAPITGSPYERACEVWKWLTATAPLRDQVDRTSRRVQEWRLRSSPAFLDPSARRAG